MDVPAFNADRAASSLGRPELVRDTATPAGLLGIVHNVLHRLTVLAVQ